MPQFVDEYFVIATDQIVITYDDFSRWSKEINAENWTDILLAEGVSFARADHRTVPCGYRTLMVWQLAEKLYQKPGLYQRLCDKSLPEDDYQSVTELTAAILEGRADYAFQYLSVAKQFGLNYVKLPSKINLSNPAHADFYSEAGHMGKTVFSQTGHIKGRSHRICSCGGKTFRAKKIGASIH